MLLQQLAGINTLMYYSATILQAPAITMPSHSPDLSLSGWEWLQRPLPL